MPQDYYLEWHSKNQHQGGKPMQIHDIILTLLESGVAIESDSDGFRALIGNSWIRLDDDPPVVDEQPAPDLMEAA